MARRILMMHSASVSRVIRIQAHVTLGRPTIATALADDIELTRSTERQCDGHT